MNIDEIADLQCRAIALKNARFAIADSLRIKKFSLPDSLAEKQRMEMLLARKESIMTESYALSDTIEIRMKHVMIDLSPDEKRDFNNSLQKKVKRCTAIE